MKRRSLYISVLVMVVLVLSASGVIAQSPIPQNVTSPQVVVGTGQVGIQGDGTAQIGVGLRPALLQIIAVAEVAVQFRILRIEPDRLLIVRLRVRTIAFSVMQQGQAMVHIRPVRHRLDDLQVDLLGVIRPALTLGGDRQGELDVGFLFRPHGFEVCGFGRQRL